MKQSLQLRMSQHLALTPQLQQSIRLLQLSTLELNQELEQILSDNPLLERIDNPLSQGVSLSADGSLVQSHVSTDSATPVSEPPSGEAADGDRAASSDADNRDADYEGGSDFGDSGGEYGSDYGRPSGEEDDTRPQLGEDGVTLREHLLEQLRLEKLGVRERLLVGILIESLDEDGYLHATEEDILELWPHDDPFEPDELADAVDILQGFDPPGVGARSISESLVLQLRDENEMTEDVDADVLECARVICAEHLQLLAQRDFTKLRKFLACDDDTLREAHNLIRRLNPYPGSAFSRHESNYVVPDIVVRRVKGEWTAMLNPDVIPKLRINDLYANILKASRGQGGGGANGNSASGGATLSSQLQEARWLIKNVQQRFDTILRVAQAIVERQRAFFTHGEVAMRPLVLREIADILGLHESTVSRVTTQKYMLTTFGTFELKYFFGSHVATETGGAASSTAIRALIKQLIGAENPKDPLSDSRLAEMLGEQGIVVARRTVAKYRETLKIPPVNLRRSL
ncbi:RNA polymerase factor sigma-54 [Derxia gummosa]|uniref:RNA polymerase sigma-54 factor n=1 Tax=Derxia gummosa DSM 723 TaxID=1121388 RepID=A0A8B6X0L2_9BURK|nr:RNA polymerase factor sigma-54 [Derxia gummosa]